MLDLKRRFDPIINPSSTRRTKPQGELVSLRVGRSSEFQQHEKSVFRPSYPFRVFPLPTLDDPAFAELQTLFYRRTLASTRRTLGISNDRAVLKAQRVLTGFGVIMERTPFSRIRRCHSANTCTHGGLTQWICRRGYMSPTKRGRGRQNPMVRWHRFLLAARPFRIQQYVRLHEA